MMDAHRVLKQRAGCGILPVGIKHGDLFDIGINRININLDLKILGALTELKITEIERVLLIGHCRGQGSGRRACWWCTFQGLPGRSGLRLSGARSGSRSADHFFWRFFKKEKTIVAQKCVFDERQF